jgi:dihydropteroate synthase
VRFRVRLLDLALRADALRELGRTGADEAGVARMADKARFVALRAEGLKAPAANILKQEMLSLGGDAAVARGVVNCSAPTSDVLILGTRKQIRGLLKKLRPQPFGLPTLAEEIRAALAGAECSPRLVWRGGEMDFSRKPRIMGIVNVTPDSFSDAGDTFDPEAALDRALAQVEEGADILDVGGESTRPGAAEVDAEEEAGRVVPLIAKLAARVKVPLSVDTVKASVARRAMDAGASVVNDVSGLRLDPEMARTAAETGAALVVMHMRGTPRDMQSDTRYGDLVGEIHASLAASVAAALEAGVPREAIAVDPGIGFGKSVAGNLVLLRRLREFAGLGRPILVGVSRKSFIGKTLGIERPKDRLEGSLAAAAVAVMNGAHILRAHDVAATRRAADLAWAIRTAEEE